MKVASIFMIVAAFNSFIVGVFGVAVFLGYELLYDWMVGAGLFLLGFIGLASFFWTMGSNMKATHITTEAKKKNA